MKKIVVPIDFSDDSLNALDCAVSIANKSEMGVALINVIKSGRFDFFKGVESVGTKGDFEEILMKYEGKVRHGLEYTIKNGKVFREIVDYANELDTHMIVMGSHGLSGFEEIWVGSNSFRVVSEAKKCSVLTIRKSFTKRSFDKIVLPIDTTWESRHKVPITLEVAKLFSSEVYVLGTALSGDEGEMAKLSNYVSQTCDFFAENNIQHQSKVMNGGNSTEMSIQYGKEVDADLISIMTEQDDPFSSILLGSYAQQMVHHSPIPVLCSHRKHESEFRFT